MEERNNILEQVKRRNISVEDKIITEKHKNILEKLNGTWCWNGRVLEDASEDLRRDREIVMAAVKHHGYALQFVSEDLQIDRDFVMAAVKQHGYALRFSSEDLQRDREIVMAAVKQNGGSLEFA